jgi:hypothetical protein
VKRGAAFRATPLSLRRWVYLRANPREFWPRQSGWRARDGRQRDQVLIATAIKQSKREGAEDRFSMLPANGLQRSPTVGDINGLMADLAKIAHAIATENLEHFLRAGGAGEGCYRQIGGGLIPVVHGIGKGLAGFMGWRKFRFIDRSHRPIALFDILRLGGFEVVERPKDREPTIGIRRRQAGEMC